MKIAVAVITNVQNIFKLVKLVILNIKKKNERRKELTPRRWAIEAVLDIGHLHKERMWL